MPSLKNLDITEEQLLELDPATYTLIDVRTLEEYKESHISISNNIPLEALLEKDSDISIPKDKILIVYCKSGIRSKKAVAFLDEKGYKAYNLGGFGQLSDNFINRLEDIYSD